MTKPELSYKSIWDVLSKIDVSPHVKTVNNCTYLSWAWAWGVLMDNYPEAVFEFGDEVTHHDQTVTVNCTVTIGKCDRSMWLPVMSGYQHKAQVSPDARGISDARMRCLVKCLALFGLGHYIYAGEDLPRGDGPNVTVSKPAQPADDPEAQIAEIEELLNGFDTDTVDGFLKYYKVKRPSDIPHFKLATAIAQLNKKRETIIAKA